MTPHPEEAKRYVQSVLQRMESSPTSLTRAEFSLGKKLKESDTRVKKISKDCDDMRSNIQQLQNMLRNAEAQLDTENGRAQGIIDSLVELHFDTEEAAGKEGTRNQDSAVVHSIEEAKAKKEESQPAIADASTT